MTSDVRDRTREILRAELAAAASDYCSEHGLTNVTVDEVAHGIGISRATFFRYFASKEDAVVAAARAEGMSLAARLRELDAPAGGIALSLVRIALEPTAVAARERPDQLRARVRMIASTPSLRARLASERSEQGLALEDALAEMIDDPVHARTVAIIGMAATDLGWSLWTHSDNADLGEMFDRAFALVANVENVRLA